MLPKDYRLKKRSAFKATYKTNKVIHANGISMFMGKIKNNDLPTKIGFVVSKKIHKRAVKRNKIKRLMRESYRILLKDTVIPQKHMSLIFVASSKLLDKDFNYIDSSIKDLIKRL